jgi:uncharacterized protein YqhQ
LFFSAPANYEQPMKQPPKPTYGGQAVLEGVMIRGLRSASVAVRNPEGEITLRTLSLNSLYNGPARRIPFLRGMLVMAETLTLGMRALSHSANVAAGEEEELGNASIAGMMIVSIAMAVGIFFLVPVFASRGLEGLIGSDLVTNILEGVIRLALFLAYITLIGRMQEIRRVFMYHGAEHMAVHAHEHGERLDIESVRRYPTAHPRCGTAFLLVVMFVAIVVFAFTGRDPLWWLITSRIVLIPLIASVSYEVIRFSGFHPDSPLVQLIALPGLVLQRLTTREPDDDQIEVAIAAMEEAISVDAAEGATTRPSA